MLKFSRFGVLAAITLTSFTLLVSACANPNEKTVEGSISMSFSLGDVRTFLPNVFIETDDVAYLIWQEEESQIERDGNTIKFFESQFVLSTSHRYRAKGEIVSAGMASQDEQFNALPKNIPTEREGKSLQIIKLDTLIQLADE